MYKTVLCLLLQDNQVLLAMKKRGFGKGKWNGIGGKIQKDESVEDAAIRELEEEIKVTASPYDLEKVGYLEFYFENNPSDDQDMHIFILRNWQGKPQETDEMKPQWFEEQEIPYDDMWAADRYWLPKVLHGESISGEIYFNHNGDELKKILFR